MNNVPRRSTASIGSMPCAPVGGPQTPRWAGQSHVGSVLGAASAPGATASNTVAQPTVTSRPMASGRRRRLRLERREEPRDLLLRCAADPHLPVRQPEHELLLVTRDDLEA